MTIDDAKEEAQYLTEKFGDPYLVVSEAGHYIPQLAADAANDRVKSYLKSNNPLSALQALKICLDNKLEIPEPIAEYLQSGLDKYMNDDSLPSMDKCLGLVTKRGQPPWHKQIENENTNWHLMRCISGLVSLKTKSGFRMSVASACELTYDRNEDDLGDLCPSPRVLENRYSKLTCPVSAPYDDIPKDVIPRIILGFVLRFEIAAQHRSSSIQAKTSIKKLVEAAKTFDLEYHPKTSISNDANKSKKRDDETS